MAHDMVKLHRLNDDMKQTWDELERLVLDIFCCPSWWERVKEALRFCRPGARVALEDDHRSLLMWERVKEAIRFCRLGARVALEDDHRILLTVETMSPFLGNSD
nr:unnamed protein product [Digitaria exilis]